MATKLFPMYCGLFAIEGMYEEKAVCDELLELARPNEKLIVIIPMNGDSEWVYGQCNFLHEEDHVAPFKFSNTRDALSAQGVLAGLINMHGVDAVLFTDDAQLAWFKKDPKSRIYASFFQPLQETKTGYTRAA